LSDRTRDGCVVFACSCRGGVCVTVCTVGSEPRRGSLSDRIPSSTHAFVFSFGDFIRELKRGGGRLHGWKRALVRIVERSHPDCRKPVRCSFRFNRVTGNQDRRCSVGARCRSCHRSPPGIHGQGPPSRVQLTPLADPWYARTYAPSSRRTSVSAQIGLTR
jgi:hypothetical protein